MSTTSDGYPLQPDDAPVALDAPGMPFRWLRDEADKLADDRLAGGIRFLYSAWLNQKREADEQRRLRMEAAPVAQPMTLPSPITEAMHVAACKVLVRATGLDGTPQRMLDAMLAAGPSAAPAQPADWQRRKAWGEQWAAAAQEWAQSLGTALSPDDNPTEAIRAIVQAACAQASAPPPPSEALTAAARDVLAERQRQVDVEGWTPEHDDEHGDHSMAIAAACYALADVRAALAVQTVHVHELWQWTGWSSSWFKPKDKRRNMIRAAALLLAEIERLDRAAMAKGE